MAIARHPRNRRIAFGRGWQVPMEHGNMSAPRPEAMPDQTESRVLIREFLAKNFLLSSEEFPYADSVSLLEEGVVDSTGVLELIQFLESTFDIEVEDSEAVPDNLDSVHSLLTFVTRKQAG